MYCVCFTLTIPFNKGRAASTATVWLQYHIVHFTGYFKIKYCISILGVLMTCIVRFNLLFLILAKYLFPRTMRISL